MEKDVRFFTNADGDAIAYTRFGRGPVLVVPPGWVSHLVQQWELPGINDFFNRLARFHTIIIFDKHGTGLSDRNRKDFTLEKDVRDLENLIEAIGLEQFSMFGYSMGGPLAISFAARHPGKIGKLILYGTFADGTVISREEVKTSMISLVRANWGMGASLLSWLFVPEKSGDPEAIQKISVFQRKSATAETAAGLLELFHKINVTEFLSDIQAPTLVIHRRRDRAIPYVHGQKMAAGITDSHFLLLDGDIHFPWLGDTDSLLNAIMEFLGDRQMPEAETADMPMVAGQPERRKHPGPLQKYQFFYHDILGDAPRIQQATSRVGVAQIDLDIALLEEIGDGLFGLRQTGLDIMKQRIGNMIGQAVSHHVDILVFPEMTVDLNYRELASLIFESAKSYDMMIVPGSFHDPDTRTNVCRVIGPEGILWEQKKHIPAMMSFGEQKIREGIAMPETRRVVVANTRFGRVAVVICRDFLDMDLRVELKNFSPPVDIVINPALTPVTRDFEAAHLEARRSVYAYFFFCNVAGYGKSQIHSPEKGRNQRAVAPKRENLIFKDIDLFNLRAERRKWENIRKNTVRFIQSTR